MNSAVELDDGDLLDNNGINFFLNQLQQMRTIIYGADRNNNFVMIWF